MGAEYSCTIMYSTFYIEIWLLFGTNINESYEDVITVQLFNDLEYNIIGRKAYEGKIKR